MDTSSAPRNDAPEQSTHNPGNTLLRLASAATKAVYCFGRQVTSYIVGGTLGFIYWLEDNDTPDSPIHDRKVESAETAPPPSLAGTIRMIISFIKESWEHVKSGADHRDELINRGKPPDDSGDDKDFRILGELPEILGGIFFTYMVTILLAAPLLYFLPFPWLVALLLNSPYLLDVKPYGDVFIDNLFKGSKHQQFL